MATVSRIVAAQPSQTLTPTYVPRAVRVGFTLIRQQTNVCKCARHPTIKTPPSNVNPPAPLCWPTILRTAAPTYARMVLGVTTTNAFQYVLPYITGTRLTATAITSPTFPMLPSLLTTSRRCGSQLAQPALCISETISPTSALVPAAIVCTLQMCKPDCVLLPALTLPTI